MIWKSDTSDCYNYNVFEIKNMCEIISFKMIDCPVCNQKYDILFEYKQVRLHGHIRCSKCDYGLCFSYWLDENFKRELPLVLENSFGKDPLLHKVSKYFGERYFELKKKYNNTVEMLQNFVDVAKDLEEEK